VKINIILPHEIDIVLFLSLQWLERGILNMIFHLFLFSLLFPDFASGSTRRIALS
jgi:hypothetical protein